jgi:hypothetical protein
MRSALASTAWNADPRLLPCVCKADLRGEAGGVEPREESGRRVRGDTERLSSAAAAAAAAGDGVLRAPASAVEWGGIS